MTVDIDELKAESYLSSKDVDERISELEDAGREEYEDDDSYEAGQGELEELSKFRFAVSGQAGWRRWQNGFQMVNESHWENYTIESACDMFGSAAVENSAWHDDKWADEMLTDYLTEKLDGTEFYFRA